MLIPIIKKNPDLNDFTCRDGEIEFTTMLRSAADTEIATPSPNETPILPETAILPETTIPGPPLHTLRIPLLAGEKEKAAMLLNGEIARVDPATAERITGELVRKAAECLLDYSTDLRRQGLFILPFRYYTMMMLPDGSLSFPSPQGVALPTDFPPHPEVTAATATDDALTVAIRFPVVAHRFVADTRGTLPEGYSTRTFISYPLYIPDPKEMRGSIGSVRSASGGQATGIRFSFLSTSAVKASVAAPEKYYEIVGNSRTGYRMSSKAAPAPDYSCYADIHGYVPPFPPGALLALGDGVDSGTDPLDWIADWRKCSDPADTTKEGYLPATLPYRYRIPGWTDPSAPGYAVWPDGIDKDIVVAMAEEAGASYVMLTRPMTLANDTVSRRHAKPASIRTLRVLGLSHTAPSIALLYGSDDCVNWRLMRKTDPRVRHSVLTPPRLFWRLLIMLSQPAPPLSIEVSLKINYQ